MQKLLPVLMVSTLLATTAHAQSDLEQGFSGALRGCEEWVLNPNSWASGTAPFTKTVGLGNKMGLVERVQDVNLPPESMRRGNHYWRINSTQTAGYVMVVSDQLPMCHITGGGDADLQPVVESVLNSAAFAARWADAGNKVQGDMVSTTYRNKKAPEFSIVISRATQAGKRRDRVQVIATAIYDAN